MFINVYTLLMQYCDDDIDIFRDYADDDDDEEEDEEEDGITLPPHDDDNPLLATTIITRLLLLRNITMMIWAYHHARCRLTAAGM